ncbi:MAG: undecaprenyldiphospho-muramoylpentapeptide beta-N-acetylglucosaminyltransferase [Clostridiaceae bacterium]|nr:undecaprenyldiphospho-muramoylpentapeptide beta-N-acetylglucosaminyltransferase [Clostridiaceae bacterium]
MPDANRPVLLIAGGGTGGHIQPALAIAEAFAAVHPETDIRFCGTSSGMESTLVPAAGYPFHVIRARGFAGRPSMDWIRAALDLRAGRKACSALIRKVRPFAVVGTGGYVCGPLVAAARRARVPVLLHEQNAFPGKANRYLSRGAHTVCISYEGTERYFPKARNIRLTGNPVRSVFFHTDRGASRTALAIRPEEKMVLVLGGSQGAASINGAILDWAAQGLPAGVKVVLMTGKRNVEAALARGAGLPGLDIRDYLQDVHLYMAAADLLVCRAGALTCAEIAALGRPSVLVPYPYAAGDHQTHNALAFEKRGAAVHVPDAQFTADHAARVLGTLLKDPDKLAHMGEAARSLAMPRAAADIAASLAAILTESGYVTG